MFTSTRRARQRAGAVRIGKAKRSLNIAHNISDHRFAHTSGMPPEGKTNLLFTEFLQKSVTCLHCPGNSMKFEDLGPPPRHLDIASERLRAIPPAALAASYDLPRLNRIAGSICRTFAKRSIMSTVGEFSQRSIIPT